VNFRALKYVVAASLVGALMLGRSATAAEGLIVFSAASAGNAVEEIARQYSRDTGVRVRVSSAASSVLARQIAAGALADIFIAANPLWMDWVQEHKLIAPDTRSVLMSNQLVLAVPDTSSLPAPRPADVSRALEQAAKTGRIAMGDPDHVPVGQYAKAALKNLGLWTTVQPRLARTPNAVATIALIARREVPLGIVYASDVRLSKSVRVLAAFPATSHPPIHYEVALLYRQSHPAGRLFVAALLSDAGQATFAAHGFAPRPGD